MTICGFPFGVDVAEDSSMRPITYTYFFILMFDGARKDLEFSQPQTFDDDIFVCVPVICFQLVLVWLKNRGLKFDRIGLGLPAVPRQLRLAAR